VAWDSRGNAYIAAVLFHVKEPENGIVVAKSNAGIHGAYFHSPDETATNPVQAGFLGDYMWVDTDSHGDAHIVWADTRPIRGTAPEEDVYYAQVRRNSGHGGR
jgi:hypothetical protein